MSRQEFLRLGGALAAAGAVGAALPAVPADADTAGKASAAARAANDRTGIQWPPGQAFPHFPRARHVLAADLEEVPRDEQIMFASLQGIVNRSLPRIFLLQPGDEGKETWLAAGLGVPSTRLDSRWELLEEFRDTPTGLVVYDPDVPDTINLATSLAGVRNTLVVSPELAARLGADGFDYPVVEDLRGRFASRLEVYAWTYDNVWPHTTHRMLVGLNPLGQRTGSAYLRDYPVAARATLVWLDAAVAEERALLGRFLADMPPCSPYLGWFPPGEFAATQLLSEHSAYVVPADWFANMSVWSGTRARPRRPRHSKPPRLENKIYVTFTMSEGDNLQYIQRAMRRIWGDPARGSVPLNWGISPLLVDTAPAMLRYYQETASANDHFVAGPSGAGYINPSPWPDATFRTYTRHSGRYMDAVGLDSVYVLNRVDGLSEWLTEDDVRAYADDVDPRGFLFGWEVCTQTKMLDAGQGAAPVPQSIVRLNNTLDELTASIAEASRGWDGRSPRFLAMGVLAMRMTPSDVAQAVAGLGPEYEVVTADQYFDLIQRADRKHPINDDDVPAFDHLVPQRKMSAAATSSQPGFEPAHVLDGDVATLWHSAVGAEHPLPQALTLDLGGEYDVEAVVYTPRQDVNCNGNIMRYRVSLSRDCETFTEVATGEWDHTFHRKYAAWEPAPARHLRIEALDGYRGLASAAEVEVAFRP
jgi:GxGYxYP putative glycoside hydrolase C-terminal domain/GxGYxY sequence motif in domain of unknown function N-terminal/F5/8 type C domain